jgi:hypothetical protein
MTGHTLVVVREVAMPPWLEILLDMIGFAGFIMLAIFHRPRRKNDEPTS